MEASGREGEFNTVSCLKTNLCIQSSVINVEAGRITYPCF